MHIEAFFDDRTYTLTYVVHDEATRDAVVIDPVLDYDPLAVRVSTQSIERITAYVDAHGLKPRAILETHAHADHLSGSQRLKARYDAPVVIGSEITRVQGVFADVFDLGPDFTPDGSQFDRLLADGEVLEAGALRIEAIHTPGHTPACVTYRIEDAIFTGDTMFMPDFGTGRCDFPAGSAATLYASVVHKLYTLPDETRVFVGHDYQPGGRPLEFMTTIGASKAKNKQLRADTDEAEFVRWRTERDATLRPPGLLFESVQVNVNAGHLPEPSENGRRYLKLPIGALD